MKDWKPQRLDQLGSVARGKSRHRPRNDPALYGGQWPFFQTGDVKAANLYLSKFSQTYNDLGLAQSKLWPTGTLCITIAANIAETAILAIPGCFPDSVVGFIPDPVKSDARFIKYYIEILKQGLQNASRGTTQDNLSVDKLLTFDFLVPSAGRQREIASILATYDDLIENNTRRIAILEEMARHTYEEWFVRFLFPGHENVRMKESELGLVPAEWQLKRLSDEIELPYGKALKAEEREPGAVPVYGSSGVVGYHSTSLAAGPGIIVGRKGNVGSVHWSEHDFYPIDTVFYVRTKLPLHFVFYNLQRQNFLNNDAAVPGLNRNQAYSLPLLVPDAELLCQFEEMCESLLGLARTLARKNRNLRATRDLLLPKLISGELDVAEITVPEAAAA